MTKYFEDWISNPKGFSQFVQLTARDLEELINRILTVINLDLDYEEYSDEIHDGEHLSAEIIESLRAQVFCFDHLSAYFIKYGSHFINIVSLDQLITLAILDGVTRSDHPSIDENINTLLTLKNKHKKHYKRLWEYLLRLDLVSVAFVLSDLKVTKAFCCRGFNPDCKLQQHLNKLTPQIRSLDLLYYYEVSPYINPGYPIFSYN